MATERDAKLKITAEADFSKATEETAKLTANVEKAGEASQTITGQLKETAVAAEQLGNAEQQAGEKIVTASEQAVASFFNVKGAADEEAASMRATGEAAEQGTKQTRVSLEQLTNDLRTAREQVEQLNGDLSTGSENSSRSVRELTESFAAQAQQIAGSDAALETRKFLLQQIVNELQDVVAENAKASESQSGSADVAANALIEVKARLGEVNAAIRQEIESLQQVGSEGGDSLRQIVGATVSVEEATQIAFNAINAAYQSYNENLRLTPRQVGFIVQAVQGLEETMTAASRSGIEVTEAQIAEYQKLKVALQDVQAKAQILQDEAADARIRLKETGTQIQGVGIAVQQLTSNLGPAGRELGTVAGAGALLAGGFQQLKDQIKQLELNTLQLGKANAAGTVQIFAVIAAAYASIAAGLKLAETNQDNVEATKDLGTSFSRLASTIKDQFVHETGNAQIALQNFLASANQFASNLFAGNLQDAGREAKNAAESVAQLGANLTGTDLDVRAFNDSVRAGFSELQSLRIATGDLRVQTEDYRLELKKLDDGTAEWKATTEKTITAQQFYRQAMASGAQGQRIWSEVVKESHHDLQLLDGAISAHLQELNAYTIATQKGSAAEKELNAIRERSAKLDREAEEARRKYRDELQRASNAISDNVAQHLKNVVETGKETEAIDHLVASMKVLVPKSDEYSVALKNLAKEAQGLLDGTVRLDKFERERLQTIIDLAGKGNELTAAEKRFLDALIQEELINKKAIDSTKARLDSLHGLQTAITDLISTINSEVSAEGANETAIQKAAKAAELYLAQNKSLTAAERQRYEQIILVARSINDLNVSLHQQADASARVVQATAQETAATEQTYQVVRASEQTIREEIARKQEILSALQKQTEETKKATVSNEQLNLTYVNGVPTLTNISEKQKDVETAMAGSAAATDRNATAAGNLSVIYDGHVTKITNIATETAKAATASGDMAVGVQRLHTNADSAAATMATHQDTISKIYQNTRDAQTQTNLLAEAVDRVGRSIDANAEKLLKFNKLLEATGKTAGEAVGDSSPKTPPLK